MAYQDLLRRQGKLAHHQLKILGGCRRYPLLHDEYCKGKRIKVFNYLRYILGQMKDTLSELWTHNFIESLLHWSDAITADCKVIKIK